MTDQAPKPSTIIAAHRGGAALWPENSVTAFRGALSLGVEQIETDIHLSADGEPFILHDTRLDRTTLETGIAAERTWRELSAIRLRGTQADTIPHLDDLLDLMRSSTLGLRLELKRNAASLVDPRLFPRALESLHRFGMLRRTTFTSFDRGYLAQVRNHDASFPHLWLIARQELETQGVDGLVQLAKGDGIREIALHISQASREAYEQATAAGLRLGYYAVNDAPAIATALSLNATAFTSDRPDLAVAMRAAARA